MAQSSLTSADLKEIRAYAQGQRKRGLSASQAMRKALDREIARTEKQLDSVREQAKPATKRNTFSLRHEQ
jgi:hypothetical protein